MQVTILIIDFNIFSVYTHTGRHIYKLVQVMLYIIVGLFRSKEDEYQKFHMAQPRIFNRWVQRKYLKVKLCFTL